MRKALAIFAAAAGLLGLGALVASCGGGNTDSDGAAQAAPFDRAFIDAMVPHHEEAIAMAQAAKDAGLGEPDLVGIADAIIATQRAEIDEMLRWREEWYGSGEVDPAGAAALGMSMGAMGMQHDPADLGSAADVNATFAAMMIDHHGGAIAMARMALERAEHDEIHSLAEAVIAAQEREVEMMREHATAMHDMGAMTDAAGPATGIEGTVWVANEEGGSLTAIDAATNEVVAILTGIEGPHNVQASPDGRTVWAVSGHDAFAAMIDASTYEVHGTVPTGAEPAHVIVLPDGATAYVTNGGDDTVSVIDVAAMEVVATIPVGDYPHGQRPSPDGRFVYVANAKGGTVSVIDTQTNERLADVEVGLTPVQVAVAPDGSAVYVSLAGENAVARIDAATLKTTGKVGVGPGPIQLYVTPGGGELVVANQGTEEEPGTTVSIVDLAAFEVVATIETGQGPHGVAIDPSGRYAYITNLYGDDVAVLDLVAREVVATVPVGEAPNGISFSALAPAAAPAEADLGMGGMDDDMPGMDH